MFVISITQDSDSTSERALTQGVQEAENISETLRAMARLQDDTGFISDALAPSPTQG